MLFTLARHPDVNLTDLIDATGIDRSTMSDLVRRMTGQGLLQRRRSKKDARAYHVGLTEKGREALHKAEVAAIRVNIAIPSLLPASQRPEVAATLRTITRALGATLATPHKTLRG